MAVVGVQDKTYWVYAILCRDGDGPLYVKFGRTGRLHQRLREVSSGTPIPAKWFAFVEVPRFRQKGVEKALHSTFKDRQVRGEWFKFDADSEQDRREFNDRSSLVFLAELRKRESWSKVSVAALDAHAKESRRKYLRLGPRGKRLAIERRAKAERQAQAELAVYGV